MAQIGIFGTGRMAVRLARILVDNGHRVVLGSRRPSRAQALARVLDACACAGGTYIDAAGQPIVLPAIFLRDGRENVTFGPKHSLLRERRNAAKGIRDAVCVLIARHVLAHPMAYTRCTGQSSHLFHGGSRRRTGGLAHR